MLMMADSPLRKRSALSILDQLKAAYSSPSNCIHSNWCRIPMAVVIFVFLLILFTCFCCWAQCVACCCCSGSKSKRRASDFGQGANLLGNPSYGYRQGGLPNMPEYPIAMNDLKKPKFAVIGDDGSVTTDSPKAEQPEASSRHTSQAVERPTLPAVAILDDKESEAGGWASAETHRPHQDQQLPRFGGQPPSGFQRPNTVSAAQLSMPGQQQYGSDPFARQPRFARPPPGSYDNQPPRRLPEPPRQQLQQPYQQQQQQSQSNYSVPNSGGRPQPGASDRNVQQRPRWQETQDRSTPFSQRPPPLVAPQPRAPVPDWRQVGERFPEESVRTDTPDHTTLPPYPASSPGRSRNDSPDILSDIYGQYNDQPASGRFR